MKNHLTRLSSIIVFMRLFSGKKNKKIFCQLLIFSSILLLLNLTTDPLSARSEIASNTNFWVNISSSDEKSPAPTLSMSASRNPTSQTISISYKIFSFRMLPIILNNVEYSQLGVSDCGFSSDPGAPKLPVRTLFLEFPENLDLKNYNIELVAVKTHTVEDILLMPAQLAPPESSEQSFTINQEIYQSCNTYPASRILSEKIIKLRQRRLLEIRFTPVLFKPQQHQVDFAYEIELTVTFRASLKEKTIPDNPKPIKAGASSEPQEIK